MSHNTRAVDLIETAGSETPYCVCGSWTTSVAKESGIWLECSTLGQQKPLIRRLLTLDFVAHTRRLVVDRSILEAAA